MTQIELWASGLRTWHHNFGFDGCSCITDMYNRSRPGLNDHARDSRHNDTRTAGVSAEPIFATSKFQIYVGEETPQKRGAVRTLCFDLANRRLEISSEFGHALMIAVIRLPIGGGWEKFIPLCTLAAPLLVQQCCKPQDRDESMKHRRR